MASVIVEVVRIEAVRPHTMLTSCFSPRSRAWQTVIRKLDNGAPEFQAGDCVVYIPPDSTLPRELAVRLGVESYLSERSTWLGSASW